MISVSHEPVLADAVTLSYMVISIAVSLLASALLKPKQKTPTTTDKPTTLATRGSHANWLMGVQQVGPFFACAGRREIRKEAAKGGAKGFGGQPKQNVFYEVGWHMLGTNGPYDALLEITAAGKTIFTGPITSDSHPSGSTVDLGSEGSFQIYWGEPDQPINTFLGASDLVGISSRWPYGGYVVWNKRRLGDSPQWGIINYVLRKKTENTVVTISAGYIPPTEQLDGATFPVDLHTNGIEGVGKLTFIGDKSPTYHATIPVQLVGNSMPDGRYEVLRVVVYQVEILAPVLGPPPFPGLYETRTDVFLVGGVTGANDNGTLQTYSVNADDGVNPAHMIADLLFMPWPRGLGLDSAADADEPWDRDSLEVLGVEAETNRWASGAVAVDGEEAGAILVNTLQDLSVVVPIEYDQGMIRFVRVREPVGMLPHISAILQNGTLPEIETYLGDSPADKLVFRFTDREHDFSDMTIAIDDDGQASYSEISHAKEVVIKATNVFGVAAQWADRRNLEEAGAGRVELFAGRAARMFIPGDQITAEGFDDVILVSEVELDILDRDVRIQGVRDYYGQPASGFVNQPGGGQTIATPPTADLQFAQIEIPEVLLLGDPMTVAVPRIRANDQVVGAEIHFSGDNLTYTSVGQELDVQTGGTLDALFSASSRVVLAQGPTITGLGPDLSTALDLTGDDRNWRLGRQLCVIRSSAGVEICYLKKLTALGGSSYRLDGLIRARYDTSRLAHPAGAEVYVFAQSAIGGFQDLLLTPDVVLYAKAQPITFAGQVSLAAISPDGQVLYGKGKKPMELTGVYVSAPSLGVPAYTTGNAVTFKWGYRSANELTSGAGQQGAGVAVGVQTPRGTFTVKIKTIGDVVVQTIGGLTSPTYALSNANLIAWLGSEVSFKASVSQSDAGYTTPEVNVTVTKV